MLKFKNISALLLSLTATLLTLAGTLFSPHAVYAQPKPGYSPTSTHIFPAGGRRGTQVQVFVGAECVPPGTHFHLEGKGVTSPAILGSEVTAAAEPSPRRKPTQIPITHPREWVSEIDIADDASLGSAFWHVSCAQGGTSSRPFIVGDLPEFIETESNSDPASAEQITLPVTVNGRISGERDVDHYRFTAAAGDVVVCEVLAGRLGSRLDPVVELLDASGRRIDADEIRIGVDPVLALRIESPGEYLLRVANVTVHGGPGYVYRINISTSPFVQYAFPAGGQAGVERDIELYILSGAGRPHVKRQRIHFPHDAPAEWICPVSGLLAKPDTLPTPKISFAVDHVPNILESEPNNQIADAANLTLPVTVDGRTATANDEDWFRFSANKGEAISIHCRSFPAGTPALPMLTLMSDDGKQLKAVRSIDTTEPGCRLEWNAPANGTFLLRLRDMQFGARGGDEFIYRLSLLRSTPDFHLKLNTDSINVTQGTTTKLPVTLQRQGGMNRAVSLQLEGLPEGVTFAPQEIPPGKNAVTLTITAAADVPSRSYPINLKGRAQVGEDVIQRTARAAHLGVDAEGVSIGQTTRDRLHLTVQHKPLFRFFCAEAYLYAYRGSIFPYEMEVERQNGFDGQIVIQQGDRQNRDMDGIKILNATIPAGETKTIVPIYLPETMHINVQSQSQLYSQAYATFVDDAGQQQAMLVLSEKRNMLRTLPTVVKLRSVAKEITARPGETVACRLRLQRTTNFPGPMQLRLQTSNNTQGITVRDVEIAAGAAEVTVPIVVHANVASPTNRQLTFRATGKLGKHTIVTEAAVTLRVE